MSVFDSMTINMVQDTLASQSRLMGLCLTNKSDFHKIGCAGRITSFNEMADGSFSITLTGYCRFKTADEVPTMRKYKRFSVDWADYEHDLSINPNTHIDRDKLINSLKSYAEVADIPMDWNVLSYTPNFNIVTFFAMNLPFSNDERQQLLEALTVEDRAEVLIGLIEGRGRNGVRG